MVDDVGRQPDAAGREVASDRLQGFAGSLAAGVLGAWTSLPEIALMCGAQHERRVGDGFGVKRAVLSGRRYLVRSAGPRLVRVGPVLFVDTSIQIRRALVPVVDALARFYGPAAKFELPTLGVGSLVGVRRSCSAVVDEYLMWFRSHSVPVPAALEEAVFKVELIAHRARAAAFRSQGIRAVVVGTQHNGSTRAILAACRQNGVATYYVPHAPVARNASYADLPVDRALLRGTEEKRFYLDLGVKDGDRIHVVGDPSLVLPSPPPRTDVEHVVYAPSSYSNDVLMADVEAVRCAVDRPVLVSLHARMNKSRAARLFPRDWRILPAQPSIVNLAKSGAYVLIQHGSGTGLAALLAGVDVIDLCPGGGLPNYPYLREPYVQIASDGLTLKEAIANVRSRRSGEDGRRLYAQTWCREVGLRAAMDSADTIVSTMDQSFPRVLWDGWSVHR